MFSTVIFDFDGVVSPDNLGIVLAKFMDLIGDESFETKMLANKQFYQCLMGQLSFVDFTDEMAKIANVDKPVMDRIMKSVIETRTLNKDVMNIVTQLKLLGFDVVLYSDEIKVRFDQWVRKLGLKEIFNETICSAYIGSLKSKPESFTKVVNFLQKTPDKCLFIDDSATNVYSAEKAGLTGIKFFDAVQLASELEKHHIIL